MFQAKTEELCLKKCLLVHPLVSRAGFASGQTRNVDLQACAAMQMWNQNVSVIVYPLVCESTVLPPHHPHAFWPSTYPTTPPPFLPCCSLLLHPFPPISGRSCSIPAGPCLFISSEMAMINETLNTSSLSPGPGEPHSWVNKPSRCSTMQPQPLVWGGPTGNSLKQVATHEICQICVVLSFKIYIYEDIQTKVNLSIDGWKTKQCVLLTLGLPEHVWQTFIHVGSLWSSSSWETSFSLEKAHAVAADLLPS